MILSANDINDYPVPAPDEIGIEHDRQIDVEAAYDLMKAAESGPQAMSMTKEDIQASLNDPNTIFASVKGVNLPILMPISTIEAYATSGFFAEGAEQFLFMPIYTSLDAEETESVRQMLSGADLTSKKIVSYFEDGDKQSEDYAKLVLDSLPDGYHQEPLIDDKDGKEASITHFEGLGIVHDRYNLRTDVTSLRQVFLEGVAGGEYDEHPRTGTTLLDPEELKTNTELLDKLWRISDEQFSKLVENLPVRQNPSREEFDEIMTHPETSSIVYFEDGEPVCLTTFLHSIEPADWLRKEYFDDKFGEKPFLAYFAFMVSDANKASYKSSHKVLKMVIDLTEKAHRDMEVIFECTNVSASYIPKLVESVVNASDEIKINPSSTYTFKSYEVGRAL